MIQRFTCGVDVVNNQHSLELSCYPVNTLPQRESITNIRRSPGAVEPALAGPVADTAQQGSIGDPGTACKPAPQQLGLVEAALHLMVAVAGHPRDEVDVRAGGGGERRRGPPHHVVGQRAQGTELAGGDQRLGRPLVGEGGGGRAEREVAAAALGAAATATSRSCLLYTSPSPRD